MSKKHRENSGSDQKAKRGHKQDVVARVSFLYFAFMLVGLGIAIRLISVQIASPAVKHNAQVLKDGVFRT